MRLLKHVDYKLKIHLIINTSSMRDLIIKAEVFDRSAELSIVTGSNLDPEKYWYLQLKS